MSIEFTDEKLCKRLDELADAVTRGAEGRHEFTMRIPAELHRDADLVISEASMRLLRYSQRIAELEEALSQSCDEERARCRAEGGYPCELEAQLAKAQKDAGRFLDAAIDAAREGEG